MQYALFAGGIGIISFSVLSYLFYTLSQTSIKGPKLPSVSLDLPTLDEIPANRITLIASVVVFILVLYLFKNLIPALMAVIIIVLIPSQVAYFFQRKHRKDVLEHLGTAVKIFTNDYSISLNIKTAIQAVAESSTGSVAKAFKKAYYHLSLGQNLETVMKKLGRELGTPYGHLFAKLVTLASKNGVVMIPLFHELNTRIRVAQDQENFRYTQITVDNYFNLALVIAPVFEYLILLRIVPQVATFMFDTHIGLLVFTGWLLSIIIWFMVDRYVNDF